MAYLVCSRSLEKDCQLMSAHLAHFATRSFEIFHRFLYTKDKSVPQESARRAQASWNKLVERLEL